MTYYDISRYSDAIVRLVELTQKGHILWQPMVTATITVPPMNTNKLGIAILPDYQKPAFFTILQGRRLALFKTQSVGLVDVGLLIYEKDNTSSLYPEVTALKDLYTLAQRQAGPSPAQNVDNFVNDILSEAA